MSLDESPRERGERLLREAGFVPYGPPDPARDGDQYFFRPGDATRDDADAILTRDGEIFYA